MKKLIWKRDIFYKEFQSLKVILRGKNNDDKAVPKAKGQIPQHNI
jgi:hypothetical protein